MSKRVTAVVGTRPDAIKMLPVVRALRATPGVECRLVSTGQHLDLLQPVFEVFGIHPDADLALMKPGQSLADLASRGLTGLEADFLSSKPDLVVVQGDTTSTMSAALAAFSCAIDIAHVEAGLRTGDPKSPFPEEFNRRAVSLMADLHFAPTPAAAQNLLREGIASERVFVTGNTVVDALGTLTRGQGADPAAPPYVLVTTHRRENWGAGQKAVCRAVVRLAKAFPELGFLVFLHPNPVVRRTLHDELAGCGAVDLVEPMSHPEFLRLVQGAELVLSDSGGVQEEAAALGVPLLILRDKTERPEVLECGCARLVGTSEEKVFEEAWKLLQDPDARHAMRTEANPFGDGRASERIAGEIAKWLSV